VTIGTTDNKLAQSPVVLFDGVCNLCNFAVRLILKYEKKPSILFAPIQSEAGQKLLQEYHPTVVYDSVILIEKGKIYQQSDAALRISRKLKYYWVFFYLLIWVPSFLRNPVYRFVAANRYRWFGKRDVCMVPPPEIKERFLG
jgi:predicted DCC family thiol-disulfide oxidoreductase YuxK